jgi:hypothetical protein
MVLYIVSVDCVLVSPRIAQTDPGRRTPPRGGSVTGVSQYGLNHQESRSPTGSHAHRHRKGEESYLDTVRSNKAKPEQLIFSKTYPMRMTINSRLLDM